MKHSLSKKKQMILNPENFASKIEESIYLEGGNYWAKTICYNAWFVCFF
jgi:hypothetical protein